MGFDDERLELQPCRATLLCGALVAALEVQSLRTDSKHFLASICEVLANICQNWPGWGRNWAETRPQEQNNFGARRARR